MTVWIAWWVGFLRKTGKDKTSVWINRFVVDEVDEEEDVDDWVKLGE